MASQEITFLVPSSFELPELYSTLTESQTALALTLGAYAYQITQEHGTSLTHAELTKQLQEAAAARYEPALESAQTQLKKVTRQLEEEQQYRLEVEKRTREEERRNREEVLKEKESRIKALEVQVKDLSDSIRDSGRQVAEQFQTFKEQILKTSTGSKKKGDHGEAIFEHILERAFGQVAVGQQFDLQNVGREGHQGDLRMNWRGYRFMLEVKNYDRNVDGKEVTKFLRDMEEAKDVQIGMMISLATGITGHTKAGRVDLQLLHDGRLCVYINKFLEHENPEIFLQSLQPFLEVHLAQMTKCQDTKPTHEDDTRAAQQLERFEQQRKIILKVLETHEEQVRKMKNTLVNAKKKHEQSWIEIMNEMRECEHRVKLLLETLFDASIEDEEEASSNPAVKLTSKQLPDYVFRHTTPTLYTEDERTFIQDTLQHFKISEEGRMPTKDAREIYKKLGYSEEKVTLMRSRVFQDDVWERGKKEIRYFSPLVR